MKTSVVKHRITEFCSPTCHNPEALWTVWIDYGNGAYMAGYYRRHETALAVAVQIVKDFYAPRSEVRV